jgi:hypothetical protein
LRRISSASSAPSRKASVPDVQVGGVGGLGAPRVDHDQLAARVLAQAVELVARIGEAVGQPGIGAQHQQQVAVVDVFGRVAHLRAEEVAVEPEVAGLFLRQRVEDRARAQRPQQAEGIAAARMVALATAADSRHRLATMRGHHRAQALGNLADGGVPVDGLVAAVGAPAQRRGQAVAVVDITRNRLGLVAQIALRARVVAIAPHLDDAGRRAIAADAELDAAVDVAEVAG